MSIHSYGVKSPKNTTPTLVYYILPTQQQMLYRNNGAETVNKFNTLQVYLGAVSDFTALRSTGTTDLKKDDRENQKSLHMYSGIP